MQWNPFRRRSAERPPEARALGAGDVPWPSDGLATFVPGAMNVDRALALAPVFAAGRLLASNVASLPLQVYRQSGDGGMKMKLPPLFRQPSATGRPRDWIFRAMTSLVYRGNAVGMVRARNTLEYPTQIEWLNPDDVYVDDRQLTGRGSFEDPVWYVYGQEVPSSDIVHIPWFVMPGRVWGLSPMAAFASTVGVGLAAQEFKLDWFRSGGTPPGTFKNSTQTVDQQAANTIKRRVVQAIRSREPMVYGKDWDYTPITVGDNEAQFVETMRLGATEIATIYGIPPEMIGGDSGKSMTYSNTEMQGIDLVRFCLQPWLTTLEDALSALLPSPQYVKFNVDALIRSDSRTRYANYQTARTIGLMNIDECRALEDLPPLPDGAGEDYTPLGKAAAPEPADPAAPDAGDPAAAPPGDPAAGEQNRLRLLAGRGTG